MYKIKNLAEKTLNKKLLEEFLGFANKKLKIDQPYSVYFVDDKVNASDPLGKTAMYNPSSNSVYVYATNRHPKDILRSIAHELMHHKQNCDGRLDKTYGEDSDDLKALELEANEAGYLVREFEDGRENKSLKEEDTQPANQPSSTTQTDDAVGLAEPATQTDMPAYYDYKEEFTDRWYKKWKEGGIPFIKNNDDFNKFIEKAWQTHKGMLKAQQFQKETESYAWAMLLDVGGAIPGIGAAFDLISAQKKLTYASYIERTKGFEAATVFYVDAAITLFAATFMGVALQVVWKAAMGTIKLTGKVAVAPIIFAVAKKRGVPYDEAAKWLIIKFKILGRWLRANLPENPLKEKMVAASEALVINLGQESTEALAKKVSERLAKLTAVLSTDLTTVSGREAFEILTKDKFFGRNMKSLWTRMSKPAMEERTAKVVIDALASPYAGQDEDTLRRLFGQYLEAYLKRDPETARAMVNRLGGNPLEDVIASATALSKKEMIDILVYFDLSSRRLGLRGTEGAFEGFGIKELLLDLSSDTATKGISRKALLNQAKADYAVAMEAYKEAVKKFPEIVTNHTLYAATFGERAANEAFGVPAGKTIEEMIPVKPASPTLATAINGTKLKTFANTCEQLSKNQIFAMNRSLLETELGRKLVAETLEEVGFYEALQISLKTEKKEIAKQFQEFISKGMAPEDAFKKLDKGLVRHFGKSFAELEQKFDEAYISAFIKYSIQERAGKQANRHIVAAMSGPSNALGRDLMAGKRPWYEWVATALSPKAMIQRNILGRYVLTDGNPVMYGGVVIPKTVSYFVNAVKQKTIFPVITQGPVYQWSSKITSAILASLITYNRIFKPLYPTVDELLPGGKGKGGKDLKGNAKRADDILIAIAPVEEIESKSFEDGAKDAEKEIEKSNLPPDIKKQAVEKFKKLKKLPPDKRGSAIEEIIKKAEGNAANVLKNSPKESPKKYKEKVKNAIKPSETKPKTKRRKSTKPAKPTNKQSDKKGGEQKAGIGTGSGIGAGGGDKNAFGYDFFKSYLTKLIDLNRNNAMLYIEKNKNIIPSNIGKKLLDLMKDINAGYKFDASGITTVREDPAGALDTAASALGNYKNYPFAEVISSKELIEDKDKQQKIIKWIENFRKSKEWKNKFSKKTKNESIQQYRDKILNERFEKLTKGLIR